jgi:hypothetical protein
MNKEGGGGNKIGQPTDKQHANAGSGLKAALRPKLPLKLGVGKFIVYQISKTYLTANYFAILYRRQLPHWRTLFTIC